MEVKLLIVGGWNVEHKMDETEDEFVSMLCG